jgi:uncharacterized protein YjbI with pentapeptide repeats
MIQKRIESSEIIRQKIKKKSLWSYKVYFVYLSLLFVGILPVFFTQDLRLLFIKELYLPIVDIGIPVKEYSIVVFSIAFILLAYLKYCLMRVLQLLRRLPEGSTDDKAPLTQWLDSISENPWHRRVTVFLLSFGLPSLMMYISVWSVRLADMKISYPVSVLVILAWVAVVLFWYIPKKHRVYQPSSTPLDSIKLKRSIDANLRHLAKMETSTNMWQRVLTGTTIIFILWFHGAAIPRSELSFNFSNMDFVKYFENNPQLSNQELRSARLAGANLESANLSGINLRGANLKNANVSRANLQSADIGGAKLYDTNFESANLSNIEFRRHEDEITNTNFESVTMHNAFFEWSYIKSSSFERADLTGSTFLNVYFENVDFKASNLEGFSISRGRIRKANFSDSFFESSIFSALTEDLIFANANIKNSDFSGTAFYRADFTNANFSNSDLSNANFAGANFLGTVFKNVDLSGSKFVAIKVGNIKVGFAINLTPSQFYEVKSLYGAELPPEIEDALLETHPHLFLPLEETEP